MKLFTFRAVLIISMLLGLITVPVETPTTALAAGTGVVQNTSDSSSNNSVLAFLLNDNFDYGSSGGDLTTVSGGVWVNHSGTTNFIQYSPTGLTMPSYISSGIGGSATFVTTGEDVNASYTPQNTGSVYFSALVQLSAAQANGDYFFHIKDTGTSNLRGRFFARSSGGQVQFGLSASTSTATYSTNLYDLNTTYLVAIKYVLASDEASLYVLDTCSPVEPSTPLVYHDGTATAITAASVAIRQGNSSNAPTGMIDGIRVGTTWEDTVQCVATEPELSISKSVTPSTNVEYHSVVTYTATLANSGGTDDTSVFFTDTLPAEVDFQSWVSEPAGVVVTNDVITWNGTVPAGSDVPFVFRAIHNGDYGDEVTNTAEFSGTLDAGTASAVFTVEEIASDITFIYHDLENVVLPGEEVFLAGDFNGWSPTANPMTGDSENTVFSVTIPGLTTGSSYGYKYIVNNGSEQWDWLQTDNRSITVVATGNQDDYRNVLVNWANLQWPTTMTADAFVESDPVYGRVYIPNVTIPSGEGRGIRAEVGYGDSADLAGWSWFPAAYNVDNGNNDEFSGTMIPAENGVFSYTLRYDGNWGLGNPNADWTYGDIDGTPFQLSQTGQMTVSLHDLAITKACPPSPVLPGTTVEYTISYTLADAPVDGVLITDTLPVDVSYVSDSSGITPTEPISGTIVWDLGTVSASGSFVVTGSVSDSPTQYHMINNAWIDGSNDPVTSNNNTSCSSQGTVPSGLVSIFDIQYTTEPGGDGTYPSLLATQEITTTGTVCAITGNYFVVTEAPGAWHSITVYNGTQAKPPIGTRVLVNGTVTEYYGFTEFSYPIIISQGVGDPVCDITPVNTATAPFNIPAISEPLESVLVEYQTVTITENTLTGRNTFTDLGGGEGKWGNYGFFPVPRPPIGTMYEWLRGPLDYTFNEYRVMPATEADAKLLDVTRPFVVSTDPLDGATGVNTFKPVEVVFSEELNPETVTTGTFYFVGPLGVVDGTVTYDAVGSVATFNPTDPLAAVTVYTGTITTGIQDTTGNSLNASYLWSFTTGVQDVTPPNITGRDPASGAIDAPLGTNITITFDEELDPSTLLQSHFELVGPFGLVPWESMTYDSALQQVVLNPSGMLLPTTTYTVIVSDAVHDWAGFSVPSDQRTWTFTTQAEPPMFAYLGDIHNHTSYSDGSGTPNQAFSTGQAAGLDFMAVTDHSYAIDDVEWADTLTQANAFNVDGSFATLRGFEYTQGGEGHANVYNTVRHAVRTDTTATCTYCDYTPNLEIGVTVDGFYNWLSITGTVALDGNGTVMEFNHPGWINFNDWRYHPEVENVALLEEVGNGWGSSYVFSWDEYIRSLDYGWKVAATNNTDNHTMSWGTIGPNRTGVVTAELTRESLMDALRARRTYATEDSNAEIFFKANGYWMGSEIPNTSSMTFHVWGSDPDGELITSVELVTAGGQAIASISPNASSFDWELTEPITLGSHYYLILATQEDGDRIVSSPVWTQGVEDVRITDLTIQPSLPTIYNPSLVSARVTNRGESTHTLTISFEVDGVVVDTVPVTVDACTTGPCADAYATISWQPENTGEAVLIGTIEEAPVGDSPDDNNRTLTLDVTDEHIPLVLIDTGHNNIGVDPHGISQFVDDLTLHGYNVLFNLDELTASDLVTETVKLLILNAYGPEQLSTDEITAISDFVADGGSIWFNSMSDYTGKVSWAYDLAPRLNALVSAIENRAGELIPIRFNDDEVLDGDDNNGYPWGVLWHNFPVSDTTGVGMNVLQMQSWSDSSLMDRNGSALTEADLGPNAFLMVVGDQDPGSGTYGEANRTHNVDAEGAGYPTGDAYIYQPGSNLPAGAGIDLTGLAGRILFYTDANDPFNVFAYVAGDGKQNELFNLEAVMWLLGEPLQKETVAEARFDVEQDDTPENLDKLVWVEGVVTAGYGEFFDVLYVQDDTGGITVFAPAGTASGAVEPEFDRGDCVRVVGTVDVYQGDTEIQFFETEQIFVVEDQCIPAEDVSLTGSLPLGLTTFEASQEMSEGWLVVVTGTVTSKEGFDTIWLDDGSGPVRLFLDGYNGTWDDVVVGERLMVAGMVSEDGFGQRIRVRNHTMHPALPDDVMKLPQLYKQVNPIIDVPLGGVVTYTLVISNINDVDLTGVVLTDVLPDQVDFDSWVLQNGAQVVDDTVTWTGTVEPNSELLIILRAMVGTDVGYYGQIVTNTATFESTSAGSAWAVAEFTIESEPLVPDLSLTKSVTPETDIPLGGIVTYTLSLVNAGDADALSVVLTDSLPSAVDFGGWLIQNDAVVENDVITWSGDQPVGITNIVFTATVSSDPIYYGQTVVNLAEFDSENAGEGSDEASFVFEPEILEPSLVIQKEVSSRDDVPLGGTVTYTITLANTGTGLAEGVVLTDILPVEVDFGEWLAQPVGAVEDNDTLTWTGEVLEGSEIQLVFTVIVVEDDEYYGMTVVNTAEFDSANAGAGTCEAAFTIEIEPVTQFFVYLPIIFRSSP